MAWLCVNKDGTEVVFNRKPVRSVDFWRAFSYHDHNHVCLPKGSIKKLISTELTWKNKPVELKEEL